MKVSAVLFVVLLTLPVLLLNAQNDQSQTKWHIKAHSMTVDNCPMTACPCLLGGAPYHKECRAIGVMEIEDGNYGDVSLKGQIVGFFVDFHDMMKPDGMGYYIDKGASPEVKKALTELLSNKPFGLAGKEFKIKETTLKSEYKSGQESSFSIGDIASLTLTPLMGGDGKSQMSIQNPVDPFGAKEVFLNNGKGFYKDYGNNLEYKDNSGEVESFELSSGEMETGM